MWWTKGKEMKTLIQKASKRGQSLVEYGLVLALIAVVAIVVIKAVGSKTTSTFDNVQSQMTSQGLASIAPTATVVLGSKMRPVPSAKGYQAPTRYWCIGWTRCGSSP